MGPISQKLLAGPGVGKTYFGRDGQGSVRFLADASGAVTDTYTYDAYGLLLGQTGQTPNDYRYAGEQYDADLELYYLRARNLNPDTGRFHSIDPFEGLPAKPATLHKYAYAENNPVNKHDPSGRLAVDLASLGNVEGMSVFVGKTVSDLMRGANQNLYRQTVEFDQFWEYSSHLQDVEIGATSLSGAPTQGLLLWYDRFLAEAEQTGRDLADPTSAGEYKLQLDAGLKYDIWQIMASGLLPVGRIGAGGDLEPIPTMDLDVDLNRDGAFIEDDPQEKTTPGLLLGVNDDDDGAPDGADCANAQIDTAADKSDMRVLKLRQVLQSSLATGSTVTLSVSDKSKVRIFDPAGTARLGPVPGPDADSYTIPLPALFSGDLDYLVEGVAPGEVTLSLVCKDPNGVELHRDEVVVTVIRVGIAMDGDRDDTIDFNDPDDAQYLFWVNDDHDSIHFEENEWHEDDVDPTDWTLGASVPNCDDDRIGDRGYCIPLPGTSPAVNDDNCKRDLEDFTRLHIKVEGSTAAMAGLTYWLKFENTGGTTPSINVFEAVKSTTEYLSKPTVADDQILKHNLTASGVSTTEVQIDAIYIKGGNQVSPFIIEGRSAGTGELTLIVRANGTLVCRKFVTLRLYRMPWFYDVYSVAVTNGTRWEVQIPTSATHSNAASYTPVTDEKFLLIHGWNMTNEEKTQWVETVFKRLWWQGYQGSVALFNWPTLANFGGFWDVVSDPHNFDNSEFRSWLSADALIGVFNTLNGSDNKLRVMAHSMGNVVAGEALRRHTGAKLHTYIACQAALSAHYYDNTVAISNACGHVIPHDPFFPGTPDIMGHFPTGDATSNPYMTDNKLHVANMQNYFNRQDWALARWEINNVRRPDNWVPYFFGYSGSTTHYLEGSDRFSRGPIDSPNYMVLSTNDQRQCYMIFSYCAESRSLALGEAENGQFHDWNLHDDLGGGGMGYNGKHYSHSREFRSNVVDESDFWKQVFTTCQFQHP